MVWGIAESRTRDCFQEILAPKKGLLRKRYFPEEVPASKSTCSESLLLIPEKKFLRNSICAEKVFIFKK